MRSPLLCVLFILICSPFAFSQQTTTEIAASALNRDHLAVFRAFIDGYRRGRTDPVYVYGITGILRPDEGDYNGCMKGFPQPTAPQKAHKLTKTFADALHVHVVNPEVHTNEPADQAPAACVLGLSEIIFDAKHRRAALGYTIDCGGSGSTATEVYERHGSVWRESKNYCATGIQ